MHKEFLFKTGFQVSFTDKSSKTEYTKQFFKQKH